MAGVEENFPHVTLSLCISKDEKTGLLPKLSLWAACLNWGLILSHIYLIVENMGKTFTI